MASRTLLAVCTTAGCCSSTGCAALGLLSGAATMATRPKNPRSGLPQPLAGGPTPAGHSIFEVVGWGMAIVLGALVLAFVARLLNGRNRAPAGAADSRQRIPETAATRQFPSSAGGDPAPLETDRGVRRQPLKDS